MPNGDTVTFTPGATSATYRAERVRAAWSRIHVDVVETEPCARGLRVRAVVDLDELTPADVRVSLTLASAAQPTTCPPECRMWSDGSYANGRVLFERVLPATDDVAAGEWLVAVYPSFGITEPPVVYPLHIAARPAGSD